MTESSLSFTIGDFCSSVSGWCDSPAEPHHLMEFQERVERRLDERTGHQPNVQGEQENPYSEVGNSIVDRLLLRKLPFHVSRTRRDEAVLTHLIAGNSLSKSFDESRYLRGIFPLIHEPSGGTLLQQCLGFLLDLF